MYSIDFCGVLVHIHTCFIQLGIVCLSSCHIQICFYSKKGREDAFCVFVDSTEIVTSVLIFSSKYSQSCQCAAIQCMISALNVLLVLNFPVRVVVNKFTGEFVEQGVTSNVCHLLQHFTTLQQFNAWGPANRGH